MFSVMNTAHHIVCHRVRSDFGPKLKQLQLGVYPVVACVRWVESIIWFYEVLVTFSPIIVGLTEKSNREFSFLDYMVESWCLWYLLFEGAAKHEIQAKTRFHILVTSYSYLS